MEQVASNLPSIGSKPQQERTATTSGKAERVWTALTEIFGDGFTRNHGAEPQSIWRYKIDSLNDRQIRYGLNDLAEGGRRYAPNLSEFVKLCRSAPKEQSNALPEGVIGMARSYNIDPNGLTEDEVCRLVWARKYGGIHAEQLSEKLQARLANPPRPDF